jgi:CheY-like chemotaxis protein
VYQPEVVILMDINLPGISGLTAMRILRTDPSHGAHSGHCAERQCHAA